MILKAIGKKYLLFAIGAVITLGSFAQVKHAKITFERRTNVYKLYKDEPRMQNMMDYIKKNKIVKDNFTLYVNDSVSAFVPEVKNEQGWAGWLTQKNACMQYLNSNERFQTIELWGTPVYLRDTLRKREWKITYDKRMIAGQECRKAIWQKDDSTKIYAWYSDDIELSTGPETFNGLPGTILGLATEDGGIVYFAKEIEITFVDPEEHKPKVKEKDIKSEATLTAEIKERFDKSGYADKMIQGLFAW